MKIRHKFIKSVLISCALVTAQSASGVETLHDCKEAVAHFQENIQRTPANLLIALEDGILRYESCACELVTSALAAAHQDPELTRQIVYTAVSIAPNLANTIKDCALKSSPEQKESILLGASQALGEDQAVVASSQGGKQTVKIYSGKDVLDVTSAKTTVPIVPQGDNVSDSQEIYYLAPLNVGGVYLMSSPAGPILTPPNDAPDKDCECVCPDKPISPTEASFRVTR